MNLEQARFFLAPFVAKPEKVKVDGEVVEAFDLPTSAATLILVGLFAEPNETAIASIKELAALGNPLLNIDLLMANARVSGSSLLLLRSAVEKGLDKTAATAFGKLLNS